MNLTYFPYLLVPLAGRSDLWLLLLPVLVIVGILTGVYTVRRRSRSKSETRPR
jgi:uncharacterized protein YneF (UPF0154 family)